MLTNQPEVPAWVCVWKQCDWLMYWKPSIAFFAEFTSFDKTTIIENTPRGLGLSTSFFYKYFFKQRESVHAGPQFPKKLSSVEHLDLPFSGFLFVAHFS